ncbi:MAG: alpha-N-acetylglucosaminidase TIM-barrel domain-containing protein [Akkermansia sp.]|nr:alpha-N-acetylglucosaminidase TIM-barrel domain-containing protein [Akkermansia sp.]
MKTWAAWIILWCFIITQTAKGDAAADVITRFAGDKAPFSLAPLPGSGKHEFITTVKNGTLIIQANSPVAHCRGFYHATKYNKRGICSWSGNRFEAGLWPNGQQLRGGSPFEYRYYLNVVSFGYTTVFWDWTRWEKEIDRMALHGINMPLALTAQEAIMARVYNRLGLNADEIARSFSGPAHLPWLRMGNISGIDAPHLHRTLAPHYTNFYTLSINHSIILERLTSITSYSLPK